MSASRFAFTETGEPRSQAEIDILEAEEAFNEQAAIELAEKEAAISRQRETKRHNGDRKAAYLPDAHRPLPCDPDAEKGLLGSILLGPREVMALCEDRRVSAEWFHLPAHATTFARLKEISDTAKPIDFITLTAAMRDAGELDHCGGAAFVTELFTFIPTAANAAYYVDILDEKHFLRSVIKVGTELVVRGYDEQDDIAGLRETAEAAFLAIADGEAVKAQVSVREAVMRVMEKIDAGKTEETWGLSTGYPNLDAIARGLRGGNMIGIAGDTGCGKTSLALNLVHNLCVKRGVKTLVCSLEMDRAEVSEVLLQIGSGVNVDAAVERRASNEELRLMGEAATRLSLAPLTIRDETELSILQIRSIARRLKPRLIVLDYAQLIRGGKKRYERSDLEIADVSKNAKKMAAELGATVIIISQLNDDGKAAGSRSLIKDSNQWWIVKEEEETSRDIKICKQRRGRRDTVQLRFVPTAQKFLAMALK